MISFLFFRKPLSNKLLQNKKRKMYSVFNYMTHYLVTIFTPIISTLQMSLVHLEKS